MKIVLWVQYIRVRQNISWRPLPSSWKASKWKFVLSKSAISEFSGTFVVDVHSLYEHIWAIAEIVYPFF